MINSRIARLREWMRKEGLNAFITPSTDPHCGEYVPRRWQSREWISGFTGSAGTAVVTLDKAALWTDNRYFLQAEEQLKGSEYQLMKIGLEDTPSVQDWLKQTLHCDDKVGVDGWCYTVDGINELHQALNPFGISVMPVGDPYDEIWEDRPAIPCAPIITLGEDLTGESRESRIQWLRKWLVKQGADAILLTALDQIAWLLNVRGSDIAYNPLVISYLLVTLDDVFWFVRKDVYAEPDPDTADTFEELTADGVTICDYSDVNFTLASLRENGVDRICVDPSGLNVALRDAIDDGDQLPEVVECPSPVPLRKAVKNAVQIEGMREAHLEDGLVMERFLYWVEQHIGSVNEWEAACYLGSLRAQITGYRGDSFETISAYGPSAALPHYSTPREGSALLEAHGLYLCDSGGQYLFGTTDITRTVPLGPCTALEREDYTLVLKGHIDLAMAVFPKGTCGPHLDILAREPLWRYKRNFGHGTGHGVGFFLGVHEGPHEFRQNFNSVPFQPGFVVTDEPGIYREGMHGVRHENVLLCHALGDNEFGSWLGFEPLTLCHYDTSCLELSLLTEDERNWLNAYNERVYRTLSPRLPAEVAAWLRNKTLPI